MRLTKEQAAIVERLALTQKQYGLRLTREAQAKLDQASKHFKNSADMLMRLAEDQAKPTLKIIEGGKDAGEN